MNKKILVCQRMLALTVVIKQVPILIATLAVASMIVALLHSSGARAGETCRIQESGFSDLEKCGAKLEEIITQTPTPPACNDRSVDLRTAAVGFKCRTSKGAIFERVWRANFGEAWKGPDGLIWSDFIALHSQYYADAACTEVGGTLPSRADFERGEANGFREVLPNMKYRLFWSRSVGPKNSDDAYIFYCESGDIGYDDRDREFSVRCAGR